MASGNLWQLFKSVTEQGAQQMATVLARNGNSYDVQVMGGGISVATSHHLPLIKVPFNINRLVNL